MKREHILCLLGYDPGLLRELTVAQRHSMRGGAVAWLVACLLLGLSAAYAAYLVQPVPASPILAGLGVTLLTLNLLRVLNAGGGSGIGGNLRASEAASRRYRPSLIPAVVFGVLAAILSQPAQLGFWPELDPQVQEHRDTLIRQHDEAATHLLASESYYRDQLARADFPIFRLKLIWQAPKRALRLTLIMCLLVLLPAFWSQVVSIRALRAYELQRTRRTHALASQVQTRGAQEIDALLSAWPSYVPAASELSRSELSRMTPTNAKSPLLRRLPS